MATIMIVASKLNELNKMMKIKYSKIGAFPNMTMFNQLSDLDVRQRFNVDYKVTFECKNQEINNQTQMLNNDFSKYFDVLLIQKMNQQNNNDDAKKSLMKFNVLMFVDHENLLMDINNDDDLLKLLTAKCAANATALFLITDNHNDDNDSMMIVTELLSSLLPYRTMVEINIPYSLLKFGIDGSNISSVVLQLAALNVSVENDNNIMNNDDNIYLMKQKTMMAILLHIVFSDDKNDHNDDKMMMMKIIQNSNNKKLTNNCKIEINTENINFSYYCDEYYEIIFNVCVFLSQKFDIMQTNGSMMIMKKTLINDENKLQSHINQSFIVTDENDNDEKMIKSKSSISSQSNTNKSEYAFEKTLNNYKFYVANDKNSFKSNLMRITMMESTSKLYFLPTTTTSTSSHQHFFSFFMQLNPMMIKSQEKTFISNNTPYYYYPSNYNNNNNNNNHVVGATNTAVTANDNDDDDEKKAGYLMIISKNNEEMQLNCQKNSLQSFKESDQSGIVSNNSCNYIKLVNIYSGHDMVKKTTAAAETYADKNINELLFSHINDKNETETLIDNTVNITCDDFNYLNYNIINNKINDQIHKDKKFRLKDDNKMMMMMMMKEKTTEKKAASAAATNYKPLMTQIDMLIECQQREKALIKQYEANNHGERLRLRLCGGGGDSLSGTSGWGSPPSNQTSNNNNANAGQWGASAQQTPQQNWNQPPQQNNAGPSSAQQQVQSQQVQQQQNSAVGQAQQASGAQQKPLTPGGGAGGWNQQPSNPNQPNQQAVGPPTVPASGIVGGGTSAVAAKNQLEQLNSMREALFAQDGWGCQNVNQDTNWDVPGSPEPGPRGDPAGATASGAAQWKSQNINNGTELWEANLRNGGQPPPQPVQKTPWNHTPTTNIGGHWGEDDEETAENTSVWTANQNNQQQPPGWNQGTGATAAASANAMWPANQSVGGVSGANIPKKDDWGNVGASGSSNNWDPRSPGAGAGANSMDLRNIDPRAANVDMRMIDARDQMQGNLRGVTGRLNGSADMWQHPGMNKIVGPNAAVAGNAANNPQWPGSQPQVGGPKDIDMGVKQTSGWESSPPASRRPLGAANLDDGTSFWGQGNRVPGSVQDPMGRNNFGRTPIGATGPTLPPNRLPNAGIEPKGNTWSALHQGSGAGGNRNAWDDPHGSKWEDNSHIGAGAGGLTPWNDGPNGPLWNKANKPTWPDNNDISSDWPPQNKLNNTSSEIIRSSKQFRILIESGFKKDEAELALRTTNMNVEEAIELLQQQQRNANIEPWHHNANPGGFDHSPFPGNRYPGPQMPFPPNNNPKLPNANAGGPGGNIGLNNLPMQFNKHLPHQAGAPNSFSQQAAVASQSGQPSAHHLRNLVQQIQKAVQAGYLNHQILNQPLAPQTLQLLNSLLNAIQQLQVTQQNIQRNGGVNNIQLQMTINKQKQQITSLQNQIAQQQALYIKSQAGGGGGIGSSNEFLRQNSASNMGMGVGNHANDPIASLENNLSNLGLKQDPSPYTGNTTSQQSRLNQWKLPSAIDNKSTDPDFSRAPGTTSSKQSLPPTTPTSISSIGIHNEPSTWSSGRNDGGWPDSTMDADNKDWPSNNQSPAFTDLVPEFQPGKPWKGTQKNIEDDPTITPGSVARNPLSISSAKESELFGSNTAKTSPNEILSSSTWSFNPSSATQQNFNSTMSKLGGADSKSNSWSDSNASDLWAAPSLSKVAGPPPGLLGASKNGSTPVTSESSDWMGGWNSSNAGNSANGQWNSNNVSTWLLLKNLTAQIDGSTLRTLCVQHGPLQHFHLSLNHGIALCKYNSREEASKAQQALNNCVLSNTTICAESPSESEVQNILGHLGVPPGSNSGNGAATTPTNATTWRPNSQQGRAGSDSSSTWDSAWPASNSAINW
ncbi:hypothetical protein PVAND_010918 [Polypedilum vanderplanki]|uniref:UBA domain-containing protein n=1 Tax=Polypedilum vanderplanki TaxID=319348 RepID=A0A9J6CHZ3_POLVA|nr:hypothetical protein PVAND_010918 [Polypedilum vanderplanki]